MPRVTSGRPSRWKQEKCQHLVELCEWRGKLAGSVIPGFDEAYAPGYYEDTDLAFRIRQAGFRTIYQPRSRVVHFEGGSAGTDIGTGMKRYQAIHRETFLHRWRSTIQAWELPHEARTHFQGRRHEHRALVIDACTPTPDRDSGSNDTVIHLRFMQELGFGVTFAADDLCWLGHYTESLEQQGIECLYAPDIGTLSDHLRTDGWRYDLVWVYRWVVLDRHLEAIRKYAPHVKVVFVPVDLHHLRLEREARFSNEVELVREAIRVKSREIELIERADLSIVISAAEKSHLEKVLPGARVRLLPMCRQVVERTRGFANRNAEIVFLGGFRHSPNVDAIGYFLRDVWPLIRQALPHVGFTIVGSEARRHLGDLRMDGVQVLDHVPNLQPILARCRVTVAPLRFGAGVKGKVFESMCHGVPCVVTSMAIEGTCIQPDRDCLLGDDPRSFADAVIRLLTDASCWNEISLAGPALMDATYAPDVVRHAFRASIASLGLRTTSPHASVGSPHPVIGRPGRHSNEDARASTNATPDFQAIFRSVLGTAIDDWRVFEVRTREEHLAFLRSCDARKFLDDVNAARREYAGGGKMTLRGYSMTAAQEVDFEVDFALEPGLSAGPDSHAQVDQEAAQRAVNWRESVRCSRTGTNNRQRAVALFCLQYLAHGSTTARPRIYLQEQTTPFFRWLKDHVPGADVWGSEYLGPFVPSGMTVDGMRHEDVTCLSFREGSFDLVISQDVMEHVADPERGFGEAARVLAPGGKLLLTIPFEAIDRTRRRATLNADGSITHHMEPVFHGNPMDPDNGSLVFVDFGYDIFEMLRAAGFRDAVMKFLGSRQLGHVGRPDQMMLIVAEK